MADFNIAVAITMDDNHEGGFQNNPNDKGNWTGGAIGKGVLKGTKYGISAAQFPNLDIENLSKEEAAQIYSSKYWNPLYSQIAEQDIANKLFDLGVPFGPKTAVLQMQTALKNSWPATLDGVFGPITLNQINNSEPKSLMLAFKTAFVSHAIAVGANNPAERPFVSGWIRRINL